MHIFVTASLLSLSTNLDNLAIGTTLGLGGAIIPWYANLAIATLSGLSTGAAILLGTTIAAYIPGNTAELIGGIVLILIGLGSYLASFRSNPEPESVVLDAEPQSTSSNDDRESSSYPLSLLQALGLGLALTVTNFGTGISAGLIQVSIELASSLSFLTSLLTIGLGAYFGRQLATRLLNSRLDQIAGLLLAGLGAGEIFVL